ncbi:hypothetical protein D9M71_360150 [compost metagenome]
MLGDVLGHGLAGDEVGHRMHRTPRVDRPQALGHDLDLGPPHLPFQRMGLAVGVADADIVQVEQGNLAHAAACQGFGYPRAHPANTDHSHMGLAQTLQPLVAIQPGNAGEAWIFCAHVHTPKNRRALYASQPMACIVRKETANPALMSYHFHMNGRRCLHVNSA